MNDFKDIHLTNENPQSSYNQSIRQDLSDFFGIGPSSARVQNQINRDFQERMANTQWQRGITDMKKAGVNPLAAFTSAAGAVPAGSSGAGGQAAGAITGIASNIISSSARLIGDLASAKGTNMRTDLYRNNLKNLIVSSAKFIK
ncbi:hypothetical protein [Spiroplasma endosymbiont of Lonchoptera lutea]|uniref:hypothetical protein n=1 Tax=Spiroplasma endosymbiont of Lonchoptera lutea TaxID=3066297 RepID=UPI0030D0312D